MTDVTVAVINIAGEQDRPYYVPRLTGGTPGATADTVHVRVCAIACHRRGDSGTLAAAIAR